MKLSEKGCSKLGKVFQGFPLPPHIFVRILDCDFESDDFEMPTSPKEVRLSIDEALGIALAMNPTPDDTHIKEWFIERIKTVEQSK